MITAPFAALLLPVLPLEADAPRAVTEPKLVLEYRGDLIEFRVTGPETRFVGAVLLSFDQSVCHYLQGLPPLLCSPVVLGIGFAGGTDGDFVAAVPEYRMPAGITIYAQGVIADERAILSTKVVDFVLDGSVPPLD